MFTCNAHRSLAARTLTSASRTLLVGICTAVLTRPGWLQPAVETEPDAEHTDRITRMFFAIHPLVMVPSTRAVCHRNLQ